MRTRTFVLGTTFTVAALAAFVACTGDTSGPSATADGGGGGQDGSTSAADGSKPATDSGGGGNTDAGSPTDSGSNVDTGTDAGPPPPFPVTLGGRLVLWLSAEKDFAADGGGTAVWKDQSGQGNDALQPTVAAQPFLQDSGAGFGGKPALHFSGAQFLQIADAPSLQWGAGDYSVFLVERHTNGSGATFLYGKWTENGALGWPGVMLWATYDGTGPTNYVTRLDFANAAMSTDAGYNDDLTRVVGTRYKVDAGTNGDLQLFINGQVGAENKTAANLDGGTFSSVGSPAYVGGRPSLAQNITGDIAEVIGVKGTLTDTEVASLTAYLKTKYGL